MTLFWAATLIAYIVAPRRACAIRVPLRPAASEGEATYVFVPTAAAIQIFECECTIRNQCVC